VQSWKASGSQLRRDVRHTMKLIEVPIMEFDEEKVDEYTLALLYLVTWERKEGYGARAWKGFDWEMMNHLFDKGYISNPKSKAKSIVMTEDGYKKSEELFKKFFTK
jgi:hypothetical protein